ncbi:2'-5' RNA ligase family protein [Nocardioides speluncae]|uniref:2'-5' RNA ligase family protein n=1 Tax=Nocardioides speluncae TaxID=2670337 RepID=UPI001379EF97|nr:2'-5' RNA ligase family protein [Nocardioides speluncae]
MHGPTQTAVIVPIHAAEAVVARHRLRLDPAAARGVPAHITVLYPFVAPQDVDEDVVSRLATVIAATPAFDCVFAACRWFGDDLLWLAPDREQEFRRLIDAVAAEFPEHPPYEGKHDDVVPHLTVGVAGHGTTEQLRAAEAEIRGRLPVRATIEHALLIAGTDRPNSWHTVATLPLGTER